MALPVSGSDAPCRGSASRISATAICRPGTVRYAGEAAAASYADQSWRVQWQASVQFAMAQQHVFGRAEVGCQSFDKIDRTMLTAGTSYGDGQIAAIVVLDGRQPAF